MRISRYNVERNIQLPIWGNAADILSGALVAVGSTPASNNGALMKASGSSAIPDIVGVLNEMLDYSEDGETLVNGTSFVTKDVEIIAPVRLLTIEYDLSSLITCTSAAASTTLEVTSLEDDIDAAFVYVANGTGIGQLGYAVASAAGGAGGITLKAAFGTALDTSSKFVKILPRFHDLISLNSDGTKLASQAAAGAVKGLVIDTIMTRNDQPVQLNPVSHPGLTNLHNGRGVKFEAIVAIRDTAFYTID